MDSKEGIWEHLSVCEKDANEGMSIEEGRGGCKRRDEHISICNPL